MTIPNKLNLTLDTSVFIQEQDPTVVRARECCEALHRAGIIDLAVPTRLTADKGNDPDASRKNADLARARDLGAQPPAPFRIGVAGLGVDILCDPKRHDEILGQLERLFTDGITSPKRWRHSLFDADHIWAHWKGGRDYFLTHDHQTLDLARSLHGRFGIRVLAAADLLEAHDRAAQDPEGLAYALPRELRVTHTRMVAAK